MQPFKTLCLIRISQSCASCLLILLEERCYTNDERHAEFSLALLKCFFKGFNLNSSISWPHFNYSLHSIASCIKLRRVMGVQGGWGTGRGSLSQMISVAFKDMNVFSILLFFNEPTFNIQGRQLGFQSRAWNEIHPVRVLFPR